MMTYSKSNAVPREQYEAFAMSRRVTIQRKIRIVLESLGVQDISSGGAWFEKHLQAKCDDISICGLDNKTCAVFLFFNAN